MNSYRDLANTQKTEIDNNVISIFLNLAKNDDRVSTIKAMSCEDGETSFYVEALELEVGEYSLGAIANHLHELPSEIASRLDKKVLPDIINISEFMSYGQRESTAIRSLPKHTLDCIDIHIETLKPSALKAQCINIRNYKLKGNESIAERFLRDHQSESDALRAAQNLVFAGCANETGRKNSCFGAITFQDGSSI